LLKGGKAVTVFLEYKRLRDSFRSLGNEFSTTGASYGGLHYDEYQVLPWTKAEMPRYRKCLDQFFEDYFPEDWNSWHFFESDLIFGRVYGNGKAYEPFVRLASAGFDALTRITELAEEGQTPDDTHVEIPSPHRLDAWLNLVFETAINSPTAVLQTRRIKHQCQDSMGEWVDLVPDFLYYENSGWRTPGVPIRTILVNDLFKSSAEAVRLWLGCPGETEGVPVFLPPESTVPTVREDGDIRTRVEVDDERKTIRVDEVVYSCPDAAARELFKLLAQANGETRSFSRMQRDGKRLDGCTNPSRVPKKLPEPLQGFVKSSSAGYRLCLPSERLTRKK
jgi:hypothetical protein